MVPAAALVSCLANNLQPGTYAYSTKYDWVFIVQDFMRIPFAIPLGPDHLGKAIRMQQLDEGAILKLKDGYNIIERIVLSSTSKETPLPGSLILSDPPMIAASFNTGVNSGCNQSGDLEQIPLLHYDRYFASANVWELFLQHPDGKVDEKALLRVVVQTQQ